jgi:peptidoglycan/xylan/chitin deacetylase (PgdA/CDA1 family)
MPALLDVLKEHEAKVTFFVLGDRLQSEAAQALLRRAFDEGHQIALHGFAHEKLTALSNEAIGEAVERTQSAVRQALGGREPSRWFLRPPWGACDGRIARLLETMGITVVQASIIPGNLRLLWSPTESLWPRLEYEELPELVPRRVDRELHPGAIVALHTGQRRPAGRDRVWDSPYTAQNAGALIERLRARGYRLVRIDELAIP